MFSGFQVGSPRFQEKRRRKEEGAENKMRRRRNEKGRGKERKLRWNHILPKLKALLSASIEAWFSKLGSSDVLKSAREDHVRAELKKWETKLSDIREVLNDAEEKQITEQSVKAWLGELRDLAYDMEDVLEEYGYEALRRKAMSEADRGTTRTSKVRKFISSCCTTFTPIRNVKMGSKIKDITSRLEEISARKAGLGLKYFDKVEMIARSSLGRWSVTTSEVYLPRIKGRDADKKTIIEMLLKNEPAGTNVSVVSIVAMGGMGKTTLARLVFDDTAKPIASHFALKAWVCVSIEFDQVRVVDPKSMFFLILLFFNLDLSKTLKKIKNKK